MDLENNSSTEKLLAALHGKNAVEKDALEYDLLFYASFAHKTFQIMQREGPEKEGFDRLQQSFREAVEKVRSILTKASDRGFTQGFPVAEYLELSPQGMAKLMGLVQDLARIKQHAQQKDL